jgi:O-antigen ligase
LTASLVVLIAWGALAFGAVYPWAHLPLAAGCAALGASALWRAPAAARSRVLRMPFLWALGACLAGAVLQVVPLPSGVVTAISPAREGLLRAIDLRVAMGSGAEAFQPLTIEPTATWLGIVLFSSFLVLLAGLVAHFNREGIAGLAMPLVVLGLIVALIGIAQKALLGEDAATGMRIYGFWAPQSLLTTPFGPFVNRNHYAGWMLLALPFTLGHLLALADRGVRRVRADWRSRLLWLSSAAGGRLQIVAFAALMMGVALVMTRSRSGVACFLLAAGAAAAVALSSRRSWTFRAGTVAVLAVIVAGSFAWSDVRAQRFSPRVDDSIRLRREIWTVAAHIVRDFPAAGTGLDTFGTATLAYQTRFTDMHFGEAHNEYLQVAAEGGLLIGVPALAALAACGWQLRRRLKSSGDDRTARWLRFGAVTSLAAIALQSTVDFSLQMPGNAVLFVVLLAAALHDARRPERAPTR